MKMLVDRVTVSAARPFEIDDLEAHLRVADSSELVAIAKIGRAAAAEIEQFAQLALLTQTIRVTVFEPSCDEGFGLPIGPVLDGIVPTVTFDGQAFTEFDFVGGIRPYLHWHEAYHARKPNRLEIEYLAGFGDDAADVPLDLAQALMDQAALHYDLRSPVHKQKWQTNSPHMARIGARYRGVQA